MGDHRSRARPVALPQGLGTLAHGIVTAHRGRDRGVSIAARPGFDTGIQIEHIPLLAPGDQVQTAHIDREVEQKVAGSQAGLQDLPVVGACDRPIGEANSVALGDCAPVLTCGDDRDLLWGDPQMAEEERQDALSDAAKTDGMPFRNLNDGVTPVVIGGNDWASAWAVDDNGWPLLPVGRGAAGDQQREYAYRFGINLIMYVLTGNYKSDQVHVPALLERLGK